jgi:hypothetical protein
MKCQIQKNQASGYALRICLLLFFIGTLPHSGIAQCVASATLSASTGTNDNSIGSVAFDNPARIVSSNDSRAEGEALAVLFSGTTNYLKATNFGFSIPPVSSICGVRVEIEKRDGGFLSIGTGIKDYEVRLVIGNIITGDNLATSSNWPASPESFYTYGSSSELWGTTLTPAIVNASDFGVTIAARFNGIAALIPSADIDNIRMTVYYNPALPTQIISFNTTLKNNNVKVDWQTADEEIGETITLQRSSGDDHRWANLATYEAGYGSSGKKYSYTDQLSEKGDYSYRLQVTYINGGKIYSTIRNVRYLSDYQITAYPNPATDFITIQADKALPAITVSNIFMQPVKLPALLLANGMLRLDIRQLSNGLYFASIDGHQLKFMKQ